MTFIHWQNQTQQPKPVDEQDLIQPPVTTPSIGYMHPNFIHWNWLGRLGNQPTTQSPPSWS